MLNIISVSGEAGQKNITYVPQKLDSLQCPLHISRGKKKQTCKVQKFSQSKVLEDRTRHPLH